MIGNSIAAVRTKARHEIMSTSAVLILLRANLWSQRWRLIAAACAIALAASVLLSALIGLQFVRDQAPRAAHALLENNEVHLAATDTTFPFLGDDLLNALRTDVGVAQVRTAISVRALDMPGTESGELDRELFFSLEGRGMGGWISGRRDNFLAWEGEPRGKLLEGEWPSVDAIDPIEIVAPAVWGQQVGDWRRLESDGGVFRAKIVGVSDAEMSLTSTPQGVRLLSRQISPVAVERLAGGPRRPGDARITLHDAEAREEFLAEWRERISSSPGRLELWDAETIRQAGLISPALSSARMGVVTAILLSAVSVACIALGVQGSAVRERATQLSLLRTLGADRKTLAALVLAEAGVLAALGLLGALAIAAGLLSGIATLFPFLGAPAAPDFWSVAAAAGAIFVSVLAGGAWPAIMAARTRPAEVAADAVDQARIARLTKVAAMIGAAALVAAVVAIWAMPADSMSRAHVAAWLGIPLTAFAAICLTPLSMQTVSRLFARPIAWLAWTDPLVLANHVAGDGARSAGSVIAIAVGLGGFAWLLCWGASMLGSFVIDPAIPRWFVSIHPYGLERQETERILKDPAVGDFQPLTLVDTRLAAEVGSEIVPALVIGVDVGRALGDSPASLPFGFLDGDRTQAIEQLASGEGCLLSDWYASSNGIRAGDQVKVAVPGGDGCTERTYRVGAVVDLPGWRMMTKQNKVRLRGDKHRAMVVLDADVARRDFPVAHANFLLGNTLTAEGVPTAFQSELPKLEAFAASNAERETLERNISQIGDLNRPLDYRTEEGNERRANRRIVQVDDLQRTSYELKGDWGGGAVKRMGMLPLFVLGLSLFSVCGALAASFRASARELGVLRSCGMTRFGLARLALAESLLLGLSAFPVAALIGGAGAWILLEVSSVVGFRLDFTGIKPTFVVPWRWLAPGFVVTFVVCVLASLWAAWRVGRIPPATLLSGAADHA